MFVFNFLIVLVPAAFLLALLVRACVKQEEIKRSRAADHEAFMKRVREKDG